MLQRPCPECGLDTAHVQPAHIPFLLRDSAVRLIAALEQSTNARLPPSPGTWSPLEYACHVRDVFRLYDLRLQWMLAEDDPFFPNWDQDATAIAEQYGEQEPARVATELAEAAEILACCFEQVSGDGWQRTGRRSDGAQFTIETFGRYLVHDPIHHLYDLTKRRQSK